MNMQKQGNILENKKQVIIVLSLDGIFYEIEENKIWSFNYNIIEFYADKMLIKARDIVIDGEKYVLL